MSEVFSVYLFSVIFHAPFSKVKKLCVFGNGCRSYPVVHAEVSVSVFQG